jgi:hypothetical protein
MALRSNLAYPPEEATQGQVEASLIPVVNPAQRRSRLLPSTTAAGGSFAFQMARGGPPGQSLTPIADSGSAALSMISSRQPAPRAAFSGGFSFLRRPEKGHRHRECGRTPIHSHLRSFRESHCLNRDWVSSSNAPVQGRFHLCLVPPEWFRLTDMRLVRVLITLGENVGAFSPSFSLGSLASHGRPSR